MVDTVYGVNAVSGAPSYSGKQYRQANASAYAGATAARPLGGRSGVRPGTSTSTVTATSTVWTCGPFAGVADVETAAEASVYPFAFDANATGAVTAAHATLARKDIIYVQVDDPAESDGSSVPAVTRKYLAGTASGSPVAPATPVTRAFVVAVINVPASGGGSPTVTWVAPYAVGAGGVLPVADATAHAAWSAPESSIDYQLDAQQWRGYMGATIGWVHVGGKPDISAITPNAGGGITAGTPTPRVLVQNGRVHMEGQLTSGSVTYTAGVTYGIVAAGGVVSTYAPKVGYKFACSLNATAVAEVAVNTDGSMTMTSNTTFTGGLQLSLSGSWPLKSLV